MKFEKERGTRSVARRGVLRVSIVLRSMALVQDKEDLKEGFEKYKGGV